MILFYENKIVPALRNEINPTFRYDLWEQYTKELEALDISVQNFTVSLYQADIYFKNLSCHLYFLENTWK